MAHLHGLHPEAALSGDAGHELHSLDERRCLAAEHLVAQVLLARQALQPPVQPAVQMNRERGRGIN